MCRALARRSAAAAAREERQAQHGEHSTQRRCAARASGHASATRFARRHSATVSVLAGVGLGTAVDAAIISACVFGAAIGHARIGHRHHALEDTCTHLASLACWADRAVACIHATGASAANEAFFACDAHAGRRSAQTCREAGLAFTASESNAAAKRNTLAAITRAALGVAGQVGLFTEVETASTAAIEVARTHHTITRINALSSAAPQPRRAFGVFAALIHAAPNLVANLAHRTAALETHINACSAVTDLARTRANRLALIH